MSAKLINIILYQCAWFACIFGAAKGQLWLGLSVSGLVLLWHLTQTRQLKNELYLLCCALAIGLVFDQCLLSTHLIDYRSHGWSDALVPVWILALWLTFATLLNVSLRWMHSRYIYAALFGIVGGPLAYFGAEALQAIKIMDPRAYWVLALGWGCVTPLLILLSKRFDGFGLTNDAEEAHA